MSLMLVNPRRRRGAGRKRRRTAAQRAATARMLSARRAHNPRRRRHHARRRSNPIGLSRVTNPRHHYRRRSHRRHNPSLRAGNIGNLVMNGVFGAVGGVAINAITSFLPATFKTGNVLYVSRAALAIVLGTVGTKALGSRARVAAEGALAINFADFINTFAAGKLPGSQLHGVGGEYMSAYLSGTHMPQQLPYASSSFPGNPASVGTEVVGMGEYMSMYEQQGAVR